MRPATIKHYGDKRRRRLPNRNLQEADPCAHDRGGFDILNAGGSAHLTVVSPPVQIHVCTTIQFSSNSYYIA